MLEARLAKARVFKNVLKAFEELMTVATLKCKYYII